MSAFDVYLISIADNISNGSGIVFGGSIFALAIYTYIHFMVRMDFFGEEKDSMDKSFRKILIISMTLIFISGISSVLTPSSKAIAAMMIIPAVSQNEDLQELFGDGLDILKLELENWKEDLKDGE